MKLGRTRRQQQQPSSPPPLLLLLLLLSLLLLPLVTVCAGLPQGSSNDADPAAADAALSARLLQSAGGGSASSHKRHVTRPYARLPPHPPPAGDPAAALKVIRRRKVLSPRAPRRSDVSRDDVTERTFQESLRPPFLALLNATHFSVQPEFVLAQAAEHKMEPFRGFGERLDTPVVAGRPRDFRAMLRSDNSAAERVSAALGEGVAGEPSERHGKVIVRLKKVRVISAKDASELDDEPPGAESLFVYEIPGTVINSSEVLTASAVSSGEQSGAQAASGNPRKPETNTEKPIALRSLVPEVKSNITGIVPRRITSKRRPGRLLVPLPKTTSPPTTENPEPSRVSELSTKSSSQRNPNTTADVTPRRPGVRVVPLKPRRRPPGVDRTTTPRTSKTTASSTTTTTTKSPALRRLSSAAQRRRQRFGSRVSRLGPGSTTAGVSTTEAAPVNQEEKEVEKVLGLLARIRNRSRSRPSFLPKRGGKTKEGSSVTETTAAPTTTPAPTTRSSTARAIATTTSTATTKAAATTTKSTTEKATTTTQTTTSTTVAATTTTSQLITTKPTTTKASTSAPVTPRVSSATSTTTETTAQSSPKKEISSLSANDNAPSQLSTTTAPSITSPRATSDPSLVTSSTPPSHRQRPDTLRRTPLTSGADQANLLARRLQARRHTFSIRSGPKAGRRPGLPPTIPPFPLLLSTIKSAQQRGLLGRNVTISVTFPRGATGLIRSRPALTGERRNPLPTRHNPEDTNSTRIPTVPPPDSQDQALEVPESIASTNGVQQGDSSDDISVDGGSDESTAQGSSESDVQRTVLGTSLETSVSIAVSPLEFRLRRVKVTPEVSERQAVSDDRSTVDLEPVQENSDATLSDERKSADSVSADVKEKELREQEVPLKNNDSSFVVKDTQGTAIFSVVKSSQRTPVQENSKMKTTVPPSRVSVETSSSPNETETSSFKERPSSSTKDKNEDSAYPKVSSSKVADSTVTTPSDEGSSGTLNTDKSSTIFSKANNPDTNRKFASTSEHSYHSSKEHSHLQGFYDISHDRGLAENTKQKNVSIDTDIKKTFIRGPSEEDFAYSSASDLGGKDPYSNYDTEDLTPEASTTMATYVRPTVSEMDRIMSAGDSAATPPPPSALPPAVHFSNHPEHHFLDASAASDKSAPAPSSPHSVAYTTSSSPSSTTQSATTTRRQAQVLEVGGSAQAVSPDPDASATAGGPIYLVSLLFVVPVVAVLVWYLKKNHPDVQQLLPERLKSMLAHHETADTAQENFYPVEVDETAGKPSATHSYDTLARRRRWEHPRDTLRLQSVLGEGHFGQVWRAEVDNIGGHQGTLLVAVKNAKDSATAKEHQDLVRELRIMQDLGSHPNVVTLLGCCTTDEPVLVIMEYMVFGKLLTYLRENRGRHNYYNFSHDSAVLTSPDLTLFACQVAAGMEYIADKGIIHRDLAARNILVDHTKVCKVSDFGMSRSVREISTEVFEQKHRGALPIRWMSPESLYHNTFDQQTDCWSFGILLWEIITLGSTPYPGLSAREVMRSVREGYRLERPDHCQPQLYQLASSCWTAEPSWRPTFSELRNELETLLEDQNQGYVDLDRFQEEIYSTLHKSSDEKV